MSNRLKAIIRNHDKWYTSQTYTILRNRLRPVYYVSSFHVGFIIANFHKTTGHTLQHIYTRRARAIIIYELIVFVQNTAKLSYVS